MSWSDSINCYYPMAQKNAALLRYACCLKDHRLAAAPANQKSWSEPKSGCCGVATDGMFIEKYKSAERPCIV